MSIGIKCKGADCDIKETCYRFTAIPTKDQHYIEYNNKDGKCSGFMSEDSQIQMNGDIHRVGNEEYTRGKFGSFSIYKVKVRDLFVEECYFRREGIQSYSSLKGRAYIPNTGLVGSWIPNPISEVDITISAYSKEDIDTELEKSINEVRNDFNKQTLGHYRFDSDLAIGNSRISIGITGGFCRIDLEYKSYYSLIKSLIEGTLSNLEFDIKLFSVFTSTNVMSPEEIKGYVLAKDHNSDGKSNGVVLEMNSRLNSKEMTIETDIKSEIENKSVKVIEGNIVNLNAQLLIIRRLCKYGFIVLGVLVFLNLLV